MLAPGLPGSARTPLPGRPCRRSKREEEKPSDTAYFGEEPPAAVKRPHTGQLQNPAAASTTVRVRGTALCGARVLHLAHPHWGVSLWSPHDPLGR